MRLPPDTPNAIRDGGPITNFFNLRVLFSIILFLIAGYINGVIQTYIQRIAEPPNSLLPDLGYTIFPRINDKDGTFPDSWVYALVIITTIGFLLQPLMREKVIRRIFFIDAVLFFLRAFTISLTVLTFPPNNCHPTVYKSPWLEGFYVVFGVHKTCSDLLFSGHTCNMTLCALVWQYYSNGSEWHWLSKLGIDLERFAFITGNKYRGDSGTFNLSCLIAWLLTVAGYIIIICTRFHYSIDVFVGIVLTVLIFKFYHNYLKLVGEKKGLISRFFIWFEAIPQDESAELWPDTNYGGKETKGGGGDGGLQESVMHV